MIFFPFLPPFNGLPRKILPDLLDDDWIHSSSHLDSHPRRPVMIRPQSSRRSLRVSFQQRELGDHGARLETAADHLSNPFIDALSRQGLGHRSQLRLQ